MRAQLIRTALAPLALALASTALITSPSAAVTGPNIAEDFEHEYVGLVAFYDAEGAFLHRCTGSLLSPEVFLTAGHCVAAEPDGTVAASARIWFEQDAGADYDPVTDTPATSGYPYTGGVTATQLFNYGFTDLSTIPETRDVGLIVLEPGAVAAVYPEIDTYAQLPTEGAATTLGTGVRAVVDVSGYGVTRIVGKNGNHVESYRERLMGSTFVINNRNQITAGYNLQLASNFGGGRVGTCFGDSGGPILIGGTDTVIGVNSFVKNSSCAGQGFPYRVDTADVLGWFESVLAPLGLWDEVAPQ